MAENYPFAAQTNKVTWLLRVIGNSVQLPAGQQITVLNEDSGWGDVRTTVNGLPAHGSVESTDYDPV